MNLAVNGKTKLTFTQFLWKHYSGDVAKSLLHLGALGWILSAAAQIGMIKKRKDIDEKEKNFLLTQEKADGFFNVVSYYTICKAIRQLGDVFIEKGHIIANSTQDLLVMLKKSTNSMKDYVSSMSETYVNKSILKNVERHQDMTNFHKGSISLLNEFKIPKNASFEQINKVNQHINEIFKDNKIIKETFEPIIQKQKISEIKPLLEKSFRDTKALKTGVGVVTTILGSILSCNLITPIFRNMTANYFQEKKSNYYKKQAEMKKAELTQFYTYRNNAVPKSFNVFKI